MFNVQVHETNAISSELIHNWGVQRCKSKMFMFFWCKIYVDQIKCILVSLYIKLVKICPAKSMMIHVDEQTKYPTQFFVKAPKAVINKNYYTNKQNQQHSIKNGENSSVYPTSSLISFYFIYCGLWLWLSTLWWQRLLDISPVLPDKYLEEAPMALLFTFIIYYWSCLYTVRETSQDSTHMKLIEETRYERHA
jgi:hypothetical protein